MRPRYSIAVKAAALAGALIVLSGCENPYLKQFREEFGWTEARMVSDGWLKGRQLPAQVTYCYETLGQPDCFRGEKKGEEHRLIGAPELGNF